jgi:hypothetical protein
LSEPIEVGVADGDAIGTVEWTPEQLVTEVAAKAFEVEAYGHTPERMEFDGDTVTVFGQDNFHLSFNYDGDRTIGRTVLCEQVWNEQENDWETTDTEVQY